MIFFLFGFSSLAFAQVGLMEKIFASTKNKLNLLVTKGEKMSDLKKYEGVIPAFYACYDDQGEISPERYVRW